MNWTRRLPPLMIVGLLFLLAGCNSGTDVLTVTSTAPTKEFTGKNSFGDGFIAYIPINSSPTDQKEIVNVLVTQWLEHYKTGNLQPVMRVKEYRIDDIVLVEKTADDPNITAGVQFSVIPSQIPGNTSEIPKTIWWGSAVIGMDGDWWHLGLTFNVYERAHQYYWLRVVSYGP